MYDTLIQEYNGEFSKGRSIDEIVGWVEDLPPMPDVITRALRLVDDPEATPEDLAEVMQRDPALVPLILRSANSAALAQQQAVATLTEAVFVVGLKSIKSLLIASAIRRSNVRFGPLERLIWEKSLGAACAVRALCQRVKRPYLEELYLHGLMHNLGQVVLLSHKNTSKAYEEVLQRIQENGEDYCTAEREVIGFSHPLLGALVARKWDLPMIACQAIMRYPDPFEGISGEEDERKAMLKLSIEAGLAAGLGRPEGHPVDEEGMGALSSAVGYGPAQEHQTLEAFMAETKAQFSSENSTYA